MLITQNEYAKEREAPSDQFSDPKNPINAKQLLSLTRLSWDAHVAVCRRTAVGSFGWGLIVQGSLLLLLSFPRNTLTAQPFFVIKVVRAFGDIWIIGVFRVIAGITVVKVIMEYSYLGVLGVLYW